ncbi:MAG: polysaccharide biosynthesis C-terminal domain-containing protein [Rhodospirillales bacterium]
MSVLKRVDSLKIATLTSMVMRASSGLLDILVGAVMARILSLQDLGVFFLVQQFVFLWSQAASFGLPTALLKVVGISSKADDWAAVRITIRQSLYLFALASIGLVLAYAASWPFFGTMLFGKNLSLASAAFIYGIVSMRAIELCGSAFFRGVRLYSFGTFLMSIPRQVGVVSIAGIYWLLGEKTDIDTVLVIYFCVAAALGCVIILLMIRFMRGRTSGDGSTAEKSVRAMAGLNFPLMLQAVMAELALRVDLWVLGFFATEKEVAIYGAAQRLTLLLLFIMTSINLVIPPALASAYKEGNLQNLQRLTRATATAGALFALPFTLAYILFPKFIMGTVYGPVFETGSTVLVILAIGRFSGAASGNRIQLLQMTGHHSLITKNSLVFMFVSLLLCLALVKEFGAVGVAVGSAISMISRNFLLSYYCRRFVGVSTLPSFRPADLARLIRLTRGKRK